MADANQDLFIWQVRAFVYAHFAETTRAPLAGHIAAHFRVTHSQAESALRALHDKHALFLEPGTTRIRIANPFSAIPTDYKVDVRDRTYTANCAWDSFGIAAALHETHADIHSICSQSGEPIHVHIRNGDVIDHAAIVHFQVPFKNWYDDLVHT